MSKYTEAELKETCEEYGHYARGPYAPNFDKWWDNRNKPAKKVINMAYLIKSGIDCEFSDNGEDWLVINTLGRITDGKFPYENQLDNYAWCRPRMNQKMCHDGTKPIEGFIVKIYIDAADWNIVSSSNTAVAWHHVKDIEFLELDDDWAYPAPESP